MTWPDGIAAAVLTTIALLIVIHQHQTKHRSTTSAPPDPQDGERQ